MTIEVQHGGKRIKPKTMAWWFWPPPPIVVKPAPKTRAKRLPNG